MNISEEFNKLRNYFCFNHRGCLLERRDGGFIYDKIWYPNIESVDKAIDQRIEALNLSVNRIKT